MAPDPAIPASSATGFFQTHPVLRNPLDDDDVLRRCLALFLSPATLAATAPSLAAFTATVLSPQVFDWIVDAERHPPYLKGDGFTALGHPNADALVTSAGWQQLQALGLREGIVATGYEPAPGVADGGPAADARPLQMARLHLWCASSAYVACPSAMQDGAVAVLQRELARLSRQAVSSHVSSDFLAAEARAVLARALERLLARDPAVAWTSGQWMTERPGGSDVAGTETVARWAGPSDAAVDGTDVDGLPLGPWRIDGFKWFSSATDCGMALLLARTAKGLGCFFAPTRKRVSGAESMNGLRIQRLKTKLGTRALPTAELELRGMRAWLIGDEGEGVRIISGMLTVTRVYNAATAMGHLGRGLAIARAYAAVRTFPSQPGLTLQEVPLFAATTAATALHYRANTLLSFLVAALLGAAEHPGAAAARTPAPCAARLVPSDPAAVAALLRVLTPVAKARTAKVAIAGLQECMEALGGVGYCENAESPEMNVARLFRDANVLSIWEGTTDVLATDAVKALAGTHGRAALDAWVRHVCATTTTARATEGQAINAAWRQLRDELAAADDRAALLARGRTVLKQLGDVVCAVLLLVDAEHDGDVVAGECCARFVAECWGTGRAERSWRETSAWDARIAFGSSGSGSGGLVRERL